jgi:hypothetical protein
VLTLYDLQPLTHSERFNLLKRLCLRAAVPRSVRRANRGGESSHAIAQRERMVSLAADGLANKA